MLRSICNVADCGQYATTTGKCAAHTQADNRRRHKKQQQHGRNTARWRALRRLRLHLDGYQCQQCGTHDDLTVHLAEHMEGNHVQATEDDCVTLCRSCHGSKDAARAHR